MRFTVLATDRVSEVGLAPLAQDPSFEVVTVLDSATEEFETGLMAAHGLIVRSATKVGPEMLERAEVLRVIGRAGVGVDNIDVAEATRRGIPVFNAPDANTIAAAELTMALMLSLVRKVAEADHSMHLGNWDRSSFLGVELRGRTLGLVGAGRIGAEVARLATAFGMTVIGFDPYLAVDRAESLDIRLVGLDELITDSDVISIHVPLSDETRGLVGAEEMMRMKPGAFLINVSRGGVIDEAALVDSLVAGGIGGAAIDVYETEPLPTDSPLRAAPRILLTPHLGASTEEAQLRVTLEVSMAVRAALVDGDFSKAVNAADL